LVSLETTGYNKKDLQYIMNNLEELQKLKVLQGDAEK
jgi:hypothetical protein